MSLIRRGTLLVAGVLMALPAWGVEIMEWNRRPLSIPLPTGSERIVVLDRNVRVGLPAAIADPDILRVQSTGGVLYLLAHEDFDTQRVQLQDVESGEILLVDLSARQGASDEDIRIVEARPPTEAKDDERSTGSREANPGPRSPTPVALTRHAAQSLYSPLRTIEPLPGVRRVPMRLPESLPTLLPSLPVIATPLAAWALDGYTVTAVRLTNQDRRRAFELDPRWLQGDLYSATFMHPSIGPKGSAEDTTAVFIVTRGGSLAQAILLRPDTGEEGDDA
ncbi:TIGR03749 family integrating conjugative element protein [Billgrantia ethanolica]|uniref:TIGR03749 family integrating conjugative element protein n=1 Tax=Billgrantia ethanolica TaxID=2733486 RepID=A0ABS9A9E6_9GAMM|nr:TIGR03749 family integrating conjugative element protein [Halomonas ethanolica]MCE8005301.1 TIGR03749 family integrating conjugative element protein [Halomonas ethanolica]